MKEVLKIALSVVLHPEKFWIEIYSRKISYKFVAKYVFLLALIGPVLSIISMHFIERIPLNKTILYSVTTYFMDIISVYIYAYFVIKSNKKLDFNTALKITAFASTPIWLSDIVDIYQLLRPLSSLGLLYSLYLLYTAFKVKNAKKDFILFALIIFILLYTLNSLIAESIVQNPFIEKYLSHFGLNLQTVSNNIYYL